MSSQLDLRALLKEGVISQSTHDWIETSGKFNSAEEPEHSPDLFENADEEDEDEEFHEIVVSNTKLRYVCDELGPSGHGNKIWSASIALCEYLATLYGNSRDEELQVIELGAGVAIPGLFLGKYLPKSVVSLSDQQNISNIVQMLQSVSLQTRPSSFRVLPHDWGNPLAEKYDLVLVSDCIYMPDAHDALLQSIRGCLKGSAIISFSLHGNVPDQSVWNFFDKARQLGFAVKELQARNMLETMKQLQLWEATTDSQRCVVYVYELKLIEESL